MTEVANGQLVNIAGADVNKVGPGGSSPLAEAARIGSARMVEFLVDEGADVELGNPAYSGGTAVVVAVMNRRKTVVDVLIAVSRYTRREFYLKIPPKLAKYITFQL